MFGLSKIVSRILIAAIVIILLLGFLQVRSCQQARQRAAQSKVDQGQAGAFANSARDAIETQAGDTNRIRESEDLSRSNEKEIRGAKGSDAAIDPAARDAGIRALCRRAAYRNDPRCQQGAPR